VPITVDRDTRRNWLIATATGVISVDQVIHLLRTARSSLELQMWPMLFDATDATTSMTDDDIDRVIEVVQRSLPAGPRGHAAVVAGDNRFYSLLLTYEIKCAAIGVRFIRVFRQRDDGERWLQVMSAARHLS
jgi:hypothetical protein